MDCLSTEQLQAFVDGGFSPADAADLTLHIRECDKCRNRLNALRSDARLLNNVRQAMVEAPTLSNVTADQHAQVPDGAIPHSIGPYLVLERLGEGGMGSVFLAEQAEPVRRRVAVKVIKRGMDTQHVLARFEAERQALALMDHPGIAKVFHGGTTDDNRSYFVMEHVAGVQITEHCDRHRLGLESRLQLFTQVCDAVQHAHQKGVIHRDLKPSNILIAIQGDQAVPKIIDFGVAKALHQPLTERTLFTEQGQLVGTPEYMSPEQAERTAQDIDTRSDIYSLGVLMYELLTGCLPFDAHMLRQAGLVEIVRIIREEEPPKPSTRVSAVASSGDGRNDLAARRRKVDPPTLSRSLRGDLDWITMKCLEKDRLRRYGTASELASDIRRHLRHEPVEAGPPSATYRVRKFVRRHRGSVAATAAVLAALLAGLAFSTMFAIRERRAKRQAEFMLYTVSTLTGQQAIREKDPDEALAVLGHAPPHLRDWEWYYVNNHAKALVALRTAHEGDPSSVAWSRDGNQVISGAADRTIRVWDAHTGELFRIDRGHAGWVWSIAMDPGGKVAASLADDDAIRIWDLRTGQSVGTIKNTRDRPVVLKYLPNGNLVVGSNRSVRVLKPTGQKLLELNSLWLDIATPMMDVSLDGTFIASRDHEGKVTVVDSSTGGVLSRITAFDSVLRSLAIHPSGQTIASGHVDGSVIEWDWKQGSIRRRLRQHRGVVRSTAYSPDGTRIASGSDDGRAIVWDLESGTHRVMAESPGYPIRRVAFSPDSTRLAWASKNGTVGVCVLREFSEDKEDRTILLSDPQGEIDNPKQAGFPIVLTGHGGEVYDVDIDDQGDFVASGSTGGTVKIWDTRTWSESRSLPTGNLGGLVFLPDGTLMTAVFLSNAFTLWDVQTGRSIDAYSLGGPVAGLAISADGRLACAGSTDRIVRVWELSGDPNTVELRGHSGRLRDVAFCPITGRIASASEDATARLWEPTGRLVHTFDSYRSGVNSVAFSPDGRLLATGAEEGDVWVWDTSTYERVHRLKGHNSRLYAVCFNPGGTRIASGSADTLIKLWDVKTGAQVISLRGHSAAVDSLTFSRDGRLLVSGSRDGTVRIWRGGSR